MRQNQDPSRAQLDSARLDAKAQLAVCFLWTLALLAFGWLYHPIEVNGGESDQYVARAEALLRGFVPEDPHRPLLYPLLTAGLGLLVGNCFVAGKIITSISTGVLLFFSARLTAVVFGRATSWISMCMLMVNSLVIQFGVQAATDMTWAALCTVTLYLAVRAAQRPDLGGALLLGSFFALSYFTRYTTAAMLPALAMAMMLPRNLTGRQRILRIALFALGALFCLVPHFLLTYSIFDQILYNETWRTFAFKQYGNYDTQFLWTNNDFDGWLSVFLADPATIVSGAWRDAVDTTWIQNALQGSSPASWIGWLLTLCCAAGAIVAVMRRNIPAVIGMVFLGVYMTAIWVSIAPIGRHVLIVLPLCYGLVASLVVTAMRGRGAGTVLAGGVLVILVGLQTPGGISRFVESHPIEEVASARQLAERHGPVGLVSSYLSMHRYFPYPTLHTLEVLGPNRVGYLEEAIEQIHRTVAETGAHYVLVGRASLGQFTFSALREASLPDFLKVVRSDDEVLLLQVLGMGLDWIENAAATLTDSGGSIHLEFRLGPNAPPDLITAVAMIATSPSGIVTLLPMERGADGLYSANVTSEYLEVGRWSFTPGAADSEGRVCRGEPILLTIR